MFPVCHSAEQKCLIDTLWTSRGWDALSWTSVCCAKINAPNFLFGSLSDYLLPYQDLIPSLLQTLFLWLFYSACFSIQCWFFWGHPHIIRWIANQVFQVNLVIVDTIVPTSMCAILYSQEDFGNRCYPRAYWKATSEDEFTWRYGVLWWGHLGLVPFWWMIPGWVLDSSICFSLSS